MYKEYSSDELLYKCNKIGNFLYSSDDSILRKADSVGCLLALYNRNIKRNGSGCDIEVTNQEHFSIQLNYRTFLTYNKEATLLSIHCIDSTGKESSLFFGHPKRISGYNEIRLGTGCSASTKQYVFRTALSFDEVETKIKFVKVRVDMKSIINYEESDSGIIKEIIHDELSKGDRFPISDIMKKYGLKKLDKHTATTIKIFGSSISLTTIALIIIVVVIIIKKCGKHKTGILPIVSYFAGVGMSPISAPLITTANSDWEDNVGINRPSSNILKLTQTKVRQKSSKGTA